MNLHRQPLLWASLWIGKIPPKSRVLARCWADMVSVSDLVTAAACRSLQIKQPQIQLKSYPKQPSMNWHVVEAMRYGPSRSAAAIIKLAAAGARQHPWQGEEVRVWVKPPIAPAGPEWQPLATVPSAPQQCWIRWHDGSVGITSLRKHQDTDWWSKAGATHWRPISPDELRVYNPAGFWPPQDDQGPEVVEAAKQEIGRVRTTPDRPFR